MCMVYAQVGITLDNTHTYVLHATPLAHTRKQKKYSKYGYYSDYAVRTLGASNGNQLMPPHLPKICNHNRARASEPILLCGNVVGVASVRPIFRIDIEMTHHGQLLIEISGCEINRWYMPADSDWEAICIFMQNQFSVSIPYLAS